jgi:hypothetical protein
VRASNPVVTGGAPGFSLQLTRSASGLLLSSVALKAVEILNECNGDLSTVIVEEKSQQPDQTLPPISMAPKNRLFVVKVLPAPKTPEEAAQDRKDREEKRQMMGMWSS